MNPIDVFSQALPADAVLSNPETIARRYGRNVTALHRHIPLVLRPASEAEVARIVALANQYRIPLYPFSIGRNWGLGSKLPVVSGCVLVDLSRMNRIIEVNDAFGYAIIEPGVTQAQLAEHLETLFPSLTLNFTGSYAFTSIVGNVLERGDGASARVHDLLGVRGVLGNGEPFEAGGVWGYVGGSHPSHCSRYVAGADLAGLFAQSSFGIVTQMAFRLIHKPERRYLVWGAARSEELERLVDTFDYFGRQGVINRGSVNIGYENRFVQATRTLGGGEDDTGDEGTAAWNFFALLAGTARTTDALAGELTDALRPLCVALDAPCVERIVDPYAELPAFLHPLVKPLMGFPDAESIKLIYGLTGTPLPSDPRDVDVDDTSFGMKSFIPVVPHRGPYARHAATIVSAVARRFDLNVKLSFFGDGRTLITIHFRSDDPDQVRRAEGCERALWDEMAAAGFPPYRVSIDQMQRLVELHPERFSLVAQLKAALDPNNIIAPGRYAPLTAYRDPSSLLPEGASR
jgi:4-cresol dehydrogenase (hydroxylating)